MGRHYNFACPATSLGWVLEGSIHGSVKSTSTSCMQAFVNSNLIMLSALAGGLWTYAPQDPWLLHFPVSLFESLASLFALSPHLL